MKDNKKSFMKIIIYIVLLILAFVIGLATDSFNLNEFSLMMTISFSSIIQLIIMISAVLLVENIIVYILNMIKTENHRVQSMLSLISSLIKYIAFLCILCWGLTILGVNIATIIASVGVLALIVGFSAESLIADIVTGTFMLIENQYNVGDIIEVNGFRGTVTNIGIRTTCITDAGDNVKIINNSEMKNILNRSDNYSRSVCDISIPYETDIEQLEEQIPDLLNEIFESHQESMKKVPVYLGVQALQDSGILLRFVVEVDEKNIYSVVRTMNHDLLLGFRKLGVECPFPQIDVHNK